MFLLFILLFVISFIIAFPLIYITKPVYIYNNPENYKNSTINIGKTIFYSLLFPFICSIVVVSILKAIQLRCIN